MSTEKAVITKREAAYKLFDQQSERAEGKKCITLKKVSREYREKTIEIKVEQ